MEATPRVRQLDVTERSPQGTAIVARARRKFLMAGACLSFCSGVCGEEAQWEAARSR